MTFFTADDNLKINVIITCMDNCLNCGLIQLTKNYKHSRSIASLRSNALIRRPIDSIDLDFYFSNFDSLWPERIRNFFLYLKKKSFYLELELEEETAREFGKWVSSDFKELDTTNTNAICDIEQLRLEKSNDLLDNGINFNFILPTSFKERLSFCFQHFILRKQLLYSITLDTSMREKLANYLLSGG